MNSPASLANAARLHASGDVIGARRQAEDVLAADPNNLNALRFVGVLYCQTGEPGMGAEFLSQALKRDPSDEQTRLNLIQALLDGGDAHKANQVASDAKGKDSPHMLRAKATIARLLGDTNQTIAMLERAVAAAPTDHAAWNNLGNALHEADQPERAIDALARAVSLQPQLAFTHVNLGKALATANRHEDARRAFETAVRLDPNDGTAAFELGKSLLRQGFPQQALPFLGTAARLDRNNPNIFVVVGLCFARLDDLKQAEQSYRVAIHVDPTCPAAYLNLAMLLERGNRLDELEELHRQALNNDLKVNEADYVAALVCRRMGKLEEALELAQVSEPESLDPALRKQFIGEVADRLGKVDTAFSAYSEMNRLMGCKPDAINFDRTEYQRTIESLTEQTTRNWFQNWQPLEPPSETPAPAFLVGFLRSGTTLLDTILMGHPQTQVIEEEPMLAKVEDALGDRERLGQLDTESADALRALYFSELSRPAQPGKLLVDKNPLATLRAPIIYRLFPDSRFIFAVRHPCDVILSCFMQNFLITESTAAFLDLENAALVYDRAMTYWMKCRDIFPLRVHTIRYEDMVEDLEGELRPLLEFLDLPWDERMLEHQKTAAARGLIRTPSYAQVTEGIYKRASGRWERYREHLEPILPILAPWVERFGYEPIGER